MSKFNSTRVTIRPEVQTNYSPGGTKVIKFFIPPSAGFIDTADLVLRSNIKFTGSQLGVFRPNPRAGISSLFRYVTVRSGNNEATLEDLQSYNTLCASTMEYAANDSIQAIREMTEGVDRGNKTAQDSLYYTDMDDWTTQTVTASQTAKTIQTEMPFHHSGILGSGKTFPVSATGGLRVELELDDLARTLVPYNNKKVAFGSVVDVLSVPKADNAAVYSFTLQSVDSVEDIPWKIGTKLYASDADGSNKQVVGNINQLESHAGKLKVTVILAVAAGSGNVWPVNNLAATSLIFADMEDVLNGYSTPHQAGDATIITSGVSYTLSNLELVFNRITPPDGYVKAMMSKMNSSSGLSLDYRTWSLYRNNLAGMNGMLSQTITANNPHAYTILSTPYDQAKYSTAGDDNFAPALDGIQEYQYMIDEIATPNRAVQMKRLTRALPQPEMLHLRELEKALVNAGIDVRNFQRSVDRVSIGRALSTQGQVADLSKGDIRLQTLYSGATTSKQYDNQVQYCATMNVKSGVVSVHR